MSDNTTSINLDDVNVTAKASSSAASTANASAAVPYARRIIKLTFQLDVSRDFDMTGGNKLELTGLRCLVQVEHATLQSPSRCLIRVYGMSLNHINTLTKAGLYWTVTGNYVAVEAGDDVKGLAVIFNGVMIEAYPDFSEMPDAAFVIIASPSQVIQLKPVKPVSFNGATSVTTALKQIIQPAGLTLESNSVNTVLRYPYFPGTVWQQIIRAVESADVFGFYDAMKHTIAIWPKSGSREGGTTVISPENGMIGYPEFMQNRVRVRTIFDPSFQAVTPGTKIQIKSQLSAANGKFQVISVNYNISSELPGGPWEALVTAVPLGGGGSSSAASSSSTGLNT